MSEDYLEIIEPEQADVDLMLPDDPAPQNQRDDASERLRQIEMENAVLKAKQEVTEQFAQRFQPIQHNPQVQQRQPTQEELDQQYQTQVLSNTRQLFQQNNQQVLGATQNMMKPLVVANVKAAINNYRTMNIKDPEIRKEFDKVVRGYTEEQMVNFDITKIDETLGYVHTYAKGQALDNGYVPQEHRRADVPNYSGSNRGTSQSSGGGSSSGPGKKFEYENQFEREYAKMQKSFGVSDADIIKDIINERKNPTQIGWQGR